VTKAIEIKPDNARAWGNRGVALYLLGKCEEALKSFDRAIEIKPDFERAIHRARRYFVVLSETPNYPA